MKQHKAKQLLAGLADRFPKASERIDDELFAEVMDDVDFQKAAEVVKRMYRGDIEAPIQYDKWPGFIRNQSRMVVLAEERQPEYVDGQRVYWCGECKDSGIIEVWRLEPMRAVRDGQYDRAKHLHKTGNVSCNCRAGDSWANGKKPLQRFNEDKMIRVPSGGTEPVMEQALFDWIDAYNQRQRFDEFDQWNGQQ